MQLLHNACVDGKYCNWFVLVCPAHLPQFKIVHCPLCVYSVIYGLSCWLAPSSKIPTVPDCQRYSGVVAPGPRPPVSVFEGRQNEEGVQKWLHRKFFPLVNTKFMDSLALICHTLNSYHYIESIKLQCWLHSIRSFISVKNSTIFYDGEYVLMMNENLYSPYNLEKGWMWPLHLRHRYSVSGRRWLNWKLITLNLNQLYFTG